MWRGRQRDSVHPLRTLFDAAARGYTIRLICRSCRRSAVLDAHALWHHFRRRGLSGALRDVPRHCVCTGCRTRRPAIDLVRDQPTQQRLPLPPLHEWKSELRRHR